MTKNTHTTKEETIASVKSRQLIWADWMEQAVAGLSDDAIVETTTLHLPHGDYLVVIAR
jgi:hypothetical protein